MIKIKTVFKNFIQLDCGVKCGKGPHGGPNYWGQVFSNFAITNTEEPDIFYYNSFKIDLNTINKFKDTGKPTLFLWNTDEEKPTSPLSPNIIVFRTSILKSQQKSHEYVLPICRPYIIPFKPIYTLKPTLGFCGNLQTHPLRNKIHNHFLDSKHINYSFLSRSKGNAIKEYGLFIPDPVYREHTRSNVYSLCIRGGGNWSYRFWEALSYGRIPVLLDTDSQLPLKNKIHWDDIAIIGKTYEELKHKIIETHKSKDKVIDMQNNILQIVKKYLVPNAYAQEILNIIYKYCK